MSLSIDVIRNCVATADSTEPSWKKELSQAIRSPAALLEHLQLEHHIDAVDIEPDFRCLVTASYLDKIKPGDIDDPLLRQVLPLKAESDRIIQLSGSPDPVGDLDAQVSTGLLHKYHGRALLVSTAACAVHCRYCFRREYPYQQATNSGNALDATLDYLQRHSEVDEIILSGGDPLTLDDEKLFRLIDRLETINHIKTLRIHTRLPVILPSRIGDSLISILEDTRFQVVMVIHTNHANELQSQERDRLQQMHKAGIQLLNQSVLLSGVNDDGDTLVELSKRLFQCNTLPYYLHQLDPVYGAMHFKVATAHAIELHQQMTAQLPGYLVPKLVQEIAGKTAKSAIFRI